jgi:hypothetical protein
MPLVPVTVRKKGKVGTVPLITFSCQGEDYVCSNRPPAPFHRCHSLSRYLTDTIAETTEYGIFLLAPFWKEGCDVEFSRALGETATVFIDYISLDMSALDIAEIVYTNVMRVHEAFAAQYPEVDDEFTIDWITSPLLSGLPPF